MRVGAISALMMGRRWPPSGAGRGDQAKAELKNADGQSVGNVTLTDTPHGVLLHVVLTNAPEGGARVPLHTTGKCEAAFTTAGGISIRPPSSTAWRTPWECTRATCPHHRCRRAAS